MPFYSGTVSTTSGLKTLIETHAVENGWSLASYLSKGKSNIRLTAPDNNYLHINAANSPDGLTNPTIWKESFAILDSEWPVNYFIFIHSNPDIIVCVLQIQTFTCQVMMFGDIVKIDELAYNGGNFFHATFNEVSLQTGPFTGGRVFRDGGSLKEFTYDNANNLQIKVGGTFGIPSSLIIPFIPSTGYYINVESNYQGINIGIDGKIWDIDKKVTFTDDTLIALYRSPNTWNSQTHLIPMNLQFEGLDNLFHYLGYIEHIRLIRMDNYEIGDIVTIAPDKWMVFPWLKKDITYRNGNAADVYPGHSGTIGLAVRYDGPDI